MQTRTFGETSSSCFGALALTSTSAAASRRSPCDSVCSGSHLCRSTIGVQKQGRCYCADREATLTQRASSTPATTGNGIFVQWRRTRLRAGHVPQPRAVALRSRATRDELLAGTRTMVRRRAGHGDVRLGVLQRGRQGQRQVQQRSRAWGVADADTHTPWSRCTCFGCGGRCSSPRPPRCPSCTAHRSTHTRAHQCQVRRAATPRGCGGGHAHAPVVASRGDRHP